MRAWIEALIECRSRREPCALVTVIQAQGSTPREAGAKMLVTSSRCYDTIGGGNLEYQATQAARTALSTGQPPQLREFALGPDMGQCCGGRTTLLFETVATGGSTEWIDRLQATSGQSWAVAMITALDSGRADPGTKWVLTQDQLSDPGISELDPWLMEQVAELTERRPSPPTILTVAEHRYVVEILVPDPFHITLFGAGHVGTAFVRVMSNYPCTVTWVDDRSDAFPKQIPDNVRTARVSYRLTEEPVQLTRVRPGTGSQASQSFTCEEVDRAPSGTYFLVMTQSHRLDFELCKLILERGDFSYLGLIGSKTKRAKFLRRLADSGIGKDTLGRLTCPIGLASITGKRPADIAIAVAAQLLAIRSAGSELGPREGTSDLSLDLAKVLP